MQKTSSGILLSATDLAFYIGCNHATWLDLQEINGQIKAPPPYTDATLEALKKKGQEFEASYISQLQKEGKTIARISRDRSTAAEQTVQAMKDGADIIYQARLEHEQWNGWADFLIKNAKQGIYGNWSYEVEDTKFARHTKAGSILQICLYSEMLTHIQGVQPEFMYIRTPEGQEQYRVDDYLAYFRLTRKKLVTAITQTSETTYPHPVEQCEICKWWYICNERRRHDDHLGFVAGMGASQIREVANWNIRTLESMAQLPMPIPHVPLRGNIETYSKLREQARVQLKAREENRNVYELLPPEPGAGLYKLPEPSEGDIFFDFEGDPFVENTGREYLFGWVHKNQYFKLWATTDEEEKAAFESFMDTVMQIRNDYPYMHIYHFSAYEPSALKRLMGKYATREDDVDRLLRANVFVDLLSIVRHAIRAGVESYSLKELEKFHQFTRSRELKLVGFHKAMYENLLETGNIDTVEEETKQIVLDYNRDDCVSAESLRNWLEQLRTQVIRDGIEIERPKPGEGEPGENITVHQERIKPLFDALTKDVPFNRAERNNEQQAKWLLANMLDWYRREEKSTWWEYYRLRDLDDDELMNEKDAIAVLVYTGRTESYKKSIIQYYRFPEQETDLRPRDKVEYAEKKTTEIFFLDLKEQIVGIKKSQSSENIHPHRLLAKDIISQETKEESIIRLAEWVVANGIDAPGYFRAGRDLLLNNRPRTSGMFVTPGDAQQKAVNWVMKLSDGVLPVQGPPGTGKSHTAARMIVSLIKAGKKIGITALSHKVINGLLQKVNEAAAEENISINIVQKVRDNPSSVGSWVQTDDYADISEAIQTGINIIAGTSFMWSREECYNAVDVLFVDEAGQLSLIDTLAISHAGRSLVLLGDPQQLQQPQKGHHPEGTEVSALAHILDGDKTIHHEKGVFLDKTWRMHPNICNYISELFYENRLEPLPKNINQSLEGNTKYLNPGIYVEAVSHTGNTNSSREEVQVVRRIIDELLGNNVQYIDQNEIKRVLNADCIRIITPYNAQVSELLNAIPGMQAGTVDKFQGQEAPVIIFSMATSSPEDAPRGMEFLYSLNRLNVAVSRAKAVFILVASPILFEPNCRSPHQMKLANALCRLAEKANKI